MKKNIGILTFGFMFSLTGCASVLSGTQQKLEISTQPPGASCALENDKGKYYVNSTPKTLVVNRSHGALHISCNKGGYPTKNQVVKSQFNKMMAGNIVLPGSAVAAGLDLADGAAFQYPNKITVNMK